MLVRCRSPLAPERPLPQRIRHVGFPTRGELALIKPPCHRCHRPLHPPLPRTPADATYHGPQPTRMGAPSGDHATSQGPNLTPLEIARRYLDQRAGRRIAPVRREGWGAFLLWGGEGFSRARGGGKLDRLRMGMGLWGWGQGSSEVGSCGGSVVFRVRPGGLGADDGAPGGSRRGLRARDSSVCELAGTSWALLCHW